MGKHSVRARNGGAKKIEVTWLNGDKLMLIFKMSWQTNQDETNNERARVMELN